MFSSFQIPSYGQRTFLNPALAMASQLIIPLAFVTPPTPLRRVFFFLLISTVNIYIMTFTTTTNVLADHLCGCFLMARVVQMVDFILITDYQNDMRKLGQHIPASQLELWDRIKWAGDLSQAIRGVGWNFQISELKSAPRNSVAPSRWEFVRKRLFQALVDYLIIDAMQFVYFVDPFHLKGYGSAGHYFSLGSFTERCLNLAYGVFGYTVLDGTYRLFPAVSVAVGHTSPDEWPDLFMKSIGEAYTIRRMWSYVALVVFTHANAYQSFRGVTVDTAGTSY
jgi:hypothetical protein